VPALPLQAQDSAAVQSKPAPQSLAVWHGSMYCGTHERSVVVSHVGSGAGGQSLFGAQA
jgi:hypothetical protein